MNRAPLAFVLIALPISFAHAGQGDVGISGYPAACAPSAMPPAQIERLAREIASGEGVRPDLVVSVVNAESRAGRYQTSPKGALGPMQLMPETARAYEVADICDPAQNIRGGVRYLRDLLGEFGGDEMNALAAFNAGPQAVYRHKGVPPFRETALYVVSIMNRTKTFRGKAATAAGVDAPASDIAAASGWTGGQVLNLADERESTNER
ncbi:MAG TPA: lytic transglycosylase domain-containing protein [Rhodoblastus sp.]|nr:lytic transglycosylase domain-containing protein [Rhodoblastus sp.]